MRKRHKDYHVYHLAAAIIRLNSMVEMQSFLKGILTPAEIKQFYFRVRVISMLKRGFTQREVACGLGVGIATVSRGARELQNGTFDKLRF